MTTSDHYSTLEIKSTASNSEIKQAFWRLAKKFHPDKNPGNEEESERKFKQIVTAYEVLINEKKRKAYDRELIGKQASTIPNYKDNLIKKARKDVFYLCQLILLELLNHNVQSALGIYDDLRSRNPNFSFDPYMSDADVRDCEFLLAEGYHRSGKLSQAVWLYEKVLERERKKIYFKGFAQEIRLMLKSIYIQYISDSKCSEDVMLNLKKILKLDPPKRELAWIYKKAAEAYYRLDDISKAESSLRRAFQINPKLIGAKKISRKLGIDGEKYNQ